MIIFHSGMAHQLQNCQMCIPGLSKQINILWKKETCIFNYWGEDENEEEEKVRINPVALDQNIRSQRELSICIYKHIDDIDIDRSIDLEVDVLALYTYFLAVSIERNQYLYHPQIRESIQHLSTGFSIPISNKRSQNSLEKWLIPVPRQCYWLNCVLQNPFV